MIRLIFTKIDLWVAWMLLVSAQSVTAADSFHMLPATPATVAWGYYWSEARPVLHVQSGDIIEVTTVIGSLPARLEGAGVANDEIQQSLRDIEAQVRDRGPGGHILTGPIHVAGANPGDVLEVRILSVDFDIDYGYNACGGISPEYCAEPYRRIFRFDLERNTTVFSSGVEIPLRPFFGSMGVAPPRESGRWHSSPPWIHGGNIDNKEMVAGTKLFIPVHVEGALFSIGDGHAAQGDGEVNQMAIETSLRGRLQLIVRKDLRLTWPRAETPDYYITMGMDPDLMVATHIALDQAIEFLMMYRDLDRASAYVLASLAIDFRITQLVDRYVGVHAMISKELFK